MGLFAGFKSYVSSTFPGCVVRNDVVGEGDGVVLDVMCALHAFKLADEEDAPAQRLADALWFSVYDAESVAFCFDVTENTPAAKAICWQGRAPPSVDLTVEDITRGLELDMLPHYDAIISNRDARSALCMWLQAQLIVRFRMCNGQPVQNLYFIGSDETPIHVSWGQEPADAEDSVCVVKRPDLCRPMHGEADISCVFAAHVLRKECDARTVEIRTVDTDIVLIGTLNCFKGLQIQLGHYDRKLGCYVKVTFDLTRLCHAVTEKYKVSVTEWALLCVTRGTDYAVRSMSGLPDWDKYMALMCPLIKAQHCVIEDDNCIQIRTSALHGSFVEASSRTKKTTLLYKPNDGHLARVAWQLFYSMHAPLGAVAVPDCLELGWLRTEEVRGCARVSSFAPTPSDTESFRFRALLSVPRLNTRRWSCR
jgi:hypothetical protein